MMKSHTEETAGEELRSMERGEKRHKKELQYQRILIQRSSAHAVGQWVILLENAHELSVHATVVAKRGT